MVGAAAVVTGGATLPKVTSLLTTGGAVPGISTPRRFQWGEHLPLALLPDLLKLSTIKTLQTPLVRGVSCHCPQGPNNRKERL